MLRKLLLTVAIALVLLATGQTAQAKQERMNLKIDSLIAATWHMQKIMGESLTPTRFTYRTTTSFKYKRWVLRHWKKTHHSVQRAYFRVPLKSSWLCLFSHENGGHGWSANTGNGYYGGLQMDLGFQRTYGWYLLSYKGTADHWNPLEQMWTAYKAYKSGRGFGPWPNTRIMCRI